MNKTYVTVSLSLFLVALFSYQLAINIVRITSFQCFYARLGFVQPPSCLKCAHRKSTTKYKERSSHHDTTSFISCNNLVPWRRDANKPLHPDTLGENLVFVTCDTANSLINGDAYPSIQWDNKNRRILHER